MSGDEFFIDMIAAGWPEHINTVPYHTSQPLHENNNKVTHLQTHRKNTQCNIHIDFTLQTRRSVLSNKCQHAYTHIHPSFAAIRITERFHKLRDYYVVESRLNFQNIRDQFQDVGDNGINYTVATVFVGMFMSERWCLM